MIANFARHRGLGRGSQVSPATAVHSNDNHLMRRVFSDPQRPPKRVLTCHWRVRPQTGALECVWETQADKRLADAVIDEDPKRRRSSRYAARKRYGVAVVGGVADRATAA